MVDAGWAEAEAYGEGVMDAAHSMHAGRQRQINEELEDETPEAEIGRLEQQLANALLARRRDRERCKRAGKLAWRTIKWGAAARDARDTDRSRLRRVLAMGREMRGELENLCVESLNTDRWADSDKLPGDVLMTLEILATQYETAKAACDELRTKHQYAADELANEVVRSGKLRGQLGEAQANADGWEKHWNEMIKERDGMHKQLVKARRHLATVIEVLDHGGRSYAAEDKLAAVLKGE